MNEDKRWEESVRVEWGVLVGPKSNQFDQEEALIKIISPLLEKVEQETIRRIGKFLLDNATATTDDTIYVKFKKGSLESLLSSNEKKV